MKGRCEKKKSECWRWKWKEKVMEGEARSDLCSSVDGVKQKTRRDEAEEGWQREPGGLREAAAELIHRRCGKMERKRDGVKEVEGEEVQEIDEGE